MSESQCIKCNAVVGGYAKYCDKCVKKYGVEQDELWHQDHHFDNWNEGREEEFEKDLASVPDDFYSQRMKKKALSIRKSKEKALDKGVQAVSFTVKLLNIGMNKKKIILTVMKNYNFRVKEARIIYKVAQKSVKNMTKKSAQPLSEAVSVETV